MAVFRVNATRNGVLTGAPPVACWETRLRHHLDRLAPGAPVCILLHGYRYTWAGPTDACCPQRRLYGIEPSGCRALRPQAAGWAGQLGFREQGHDDGLCIAFGWEGRTMKSGGRARSFARIYRDTPRTSEALADLIAVIAGARPDLQVDLFAHSLGARLALGLLGQDGTLPVNRLILMGAAEFTTIAQAALDTAPGAEVFHLLSRANDVFDRLFQLSAPKPALQARTLGEAGLGRRHRRWLDIQLDLPELSGWMAARGHRLERDEPISHWHFYTDPGAMSLYRAILRQREAHGIAALLADGLPDRIEPRWSRLRQGLGGLAGGGGLGPTVTTGTSPLPNRG